MCATNSRIKLKLVSTINFNGKHYHLVKWCVEYWCPTTSLVQFSKCLDHYSQCSIQFAIFYFYFCLYAKIIIPLAWIWSTCNKAIESNSLHCFNMCKSTIPRLLHPQNNFVSNLHRVQELAATLKTRPTFQALVMHTHNTWNRTLFKVLWI